MKKKILSLVLTLAMVLSLFPGMTVTASAEELNPPQAKWGFAEGDYSAGSGSLSDAFDVANNSSEEVIYVQLTGNGAEEDPYYCLNEGAADMVLDLNNCTLTFTFLRNNQQVFKSNDNLTIQNGIIEVTSSKRLITAIYSEGYGDLTIEDCTINVSANGDTVGIYAYGNLTVKDSAISATNTYSSEVAYAIQLDSESTLDVVDSRISATAENAIAYGIGCTSDDSVITVTGTASEKCSVSAVGGKEAYGINSWSKVSVNNAAINVDSDAGANGIVAEGDLLTVTDCDIEVSSGDSACGIWAVTEFAVSDGSITVRGNSAATGIQSEGFDGTVEGCVISVEKYGDGFYDAFYGIHTANALTVTGGSITVTNSYAEDNAYAYAIYMETNRYEATEVALVGAPAISGESADVMLGENMTISAADYTGGKVEIDWNCMHWDEDIIVSKVDPNYVNMFRLCGNAAEEDHLEVGKDDEGNPITDNDGNYCLVVFEGPQVDEPEGGEITGTTYKWSEIIAENSDAFKATLKPGDIIENDGSGVRFYVGDRHDYKSVWMDEGATWTVPEEFAIDDDYSIVSDSWTWMKKDEDYLILVKTADAKYAELIEVEVEQNENGKFTVTFEQEEGFLYIYVPQMDLYEAGQNADVFVAEKLPMYIAMFAAQRQITTSVPAELAALAVSNGTFEVDSSMVGMLIKLQKDTEFEPQPNTYLQVGVAVVGSGRIARDITIADTANGTVTASVSTAKELDEVTLTVTPITGYELQSLTVKDAQGNSVAVEDNKFTMPRSAVTVTAMFVELGEGGNTDPAPEITDKLSLTVVGDTYTVNVGEYQLADGHSWVYKVGGADPLSEYLWNEGGIKMVPSGTYDASSWNELDANNSCTYEDATQWDVILCCDVDENGRVVAYAWLPLANAEPGEGGEPYVITLNTTGVINGAAGVLFYNADNTEGEDDYNLMPSPGETDSIELEFNTDSADVVVAALEGYAFETPPVVTVNGTPIEGTFEDGRYVYNIAEFTGNTVIMVTGEAVAVGGNTDPAPEITNKLSLTVVGNTYTVVAGEYQLADGHSWAYMIDGADPLSEYLWNEGGIEMVPSGTYDASSWNKLDGSNSCTYENATQWDVILCCDVDENGRVVAYAWLPLANAEPGIEDLSDWVTVDKSDSSLTIKFPTPEEGYEVYALVNRKDRDDLFNGDVEGYLALLGQPVAASAGAFTQYNSALIPSGLEPLYVNEYNETQYSGLGGMKIGDAYLIVLVNTAVTDTDPESGNPRYAIAGLAAGYYGASKIEDLSSWVEYDEETHTFTITPPKISSYEYASFEYVIQEYRNIDEDWIAESWNSVKGLDTLMKITEEDLLTRRAYHTSSSWEASEPVSGRLWEGQTLVIFTYDPEINYNGYYAITGTHAIAFSTDEYIREMKPELTPDNGIYNITPAEGTLFYVVNGSGMSGTGYEYNQSTGFPVISTERMEAADAEYDLDLLNDRYYEHTEDYYSGMPNPFNLGGTIQYAPGDFDIMVIRALEARGYPTTAEYIAMYKESIAPLYFLEMKNDPYVKAGYDSWDGDFNYYPLTGIFEDYMDETLENTRDKILSLEGKLIQNPDDIFDVTFYPEVGKTYIVVTSTLRQNMTSAQLAMSSPVGMTVLDQINANQIAFSMTMGRVYSMPYKYAVMPAATSSYATYQLIVGDAENSVTGVAIEVEGNRQIAAYEIDTDGKYTVEENIAISDSYYISAGDYYPIVAYHAVAAFKPVIEINDYTPSVEVEQGNIEEYDYLIVFTNVPTANYQWFRCDESGNVIEAVPKENTLRDAASSESVSGLLLALELGDSPAGTYYYICKITAEGADPVTSEVMTVTVVGTEPGEHEHEYTYTSNNDGTHNGTCECGEDAIENEPCTYVDGKCEKCGYEETETPPAHEHEYTYTSNNDGTHNGTCECGEDAIENEACEYEDGICVKCGYEEPVEPEDPTYSLTVIVKEEITIDEYIDCDNAKVTLIGLNGSEQVKTQSIGNGVYTFENVFAGVYNLVIEKEDKVKTVLVTIDGENADLGVVYLPFMEIKSEVNVTIDVEGDSTIEGALVGGLDNLAETISEDIEMEDGVSVSVEVSMQINTQLSEDVDDEHKTGIEEEARTQSDNLTFLDITIDKTITTKKTGEDAVETKDAIHDTVSLLEILIPFATDDRFDFAVYRYHEDHHTGNNVQKLTTTPNSDNEYIKVEDGVIKMYVRYFSTYAIGYSDGSEPTEYTVTFSDGAGNTKTVYVIEGETLTLPACGFTAPEGKEFKAWEINGIEYAVGDEITVTANVTVKAVWQNIEIELPEEPTEYTVSFNANGGTGTMAAVTVEENGKYTLPACGFTAPEGKEFKAWEINGIEYAVGDEITVTANMTVKAVWQDIPAPPVIPDVPVIPVTPSYSVAVENVQGGTVTVTPTNAVVGTTVTITVTPDAGFELDELIIVSAAGEIIKWTSVGNNKYVFVMPASKVTVNAAFCEIDTTCAQNASCPIWAFKDAKTTEWYHDGVHYCIENGLMNGLPGGLFAPDGTTTRAQIVTILWRLEGEPVVNYLMQFEDVESESWYTEAVRWAAAEGIVTGYSDKQFAPNDAITREQMAAILWRYCQYKGIDVSVGEDTNILSYSDAFDVSTWAMSAMQWACGAGVISGIADGNGMKLDPAGNAARAQVATMLWRFCVEIMKI